MTDKNRKDNSPILINRLIRSIDPAKKNSRGDIVINEKKIELVLLPTAVVIPQIHVSRLVYDELVDVARLICDVFPEYLIGHTLLVNQKPPSETHSLQFVRHMKGRNQDFIHILSFDLRFGSGMSDMLAGSNKDYYPEYRTGGLVLSSKLIPVESVDYDNGNITDFNSLRILNSEKMDGGERYLIQAIFDDFDPTDINRKIFDSVESDMFPFSNNILQFIHYDYFTACINIPDPLPGVLEKTVETIEPVIVAILSNLKIYNAVDAVSRYHEELAVENGSVKLLPHCVDRVKKLFSRYSVYQDDNLMLKRWRRLNVND